MTVRLKRKQDKSGASYVETTAPRPKNLAGTEQVELTGNQLRAAVQGLVLLHQLARTDLTRWHRMLIERTMLQLGVPLEDLDVLDNG